MSARRSWMAEPAIQAKTVSGLVLPGTHDTGSYSLTRELSDVAYPDIAFLWKLRTTRAPRGGDSAHIYVGPALYDFVIDLALDSSCTQATTIGGQLADGIRYFDLRVYWDADKDCVYVQHGLRGASLAAILTEVEAFVANRSGRELVLLELSHANFGDHPEAPGKVADLLRSTLGDALYVPESLDALASTTLSSITSESSRVVALNTDSPQSYAYPAGSPVLTTSGFQNSGRPPAGTDEVATLAELEAGGLRQQRTAQLYQIAWTLTAQVADVTNEALSRLGGGPRRPVVEALAKKANAALGDFVRQHVGAGFNLVTVDFYETSPVVDLAVELSTG